MDNDSDDPVLAEAFDDPTIVTALIEFSRTNELAMQAVRWALAFHVQRWHRLTRGQEVHALPERAREDVLAHLKEAFRAVARS
jgi:hypothetical protein